MVLLAVGAFGPSAAASVADPAPSSAPAEATITLIHMNDLHANLVPHLDLVRVAGQGQEAATSRVESRGGIARIATLVDRIRRDNPASLLMNVGDTYHGGVEALYTRGNAIVPAVNALGVDVGVPGNWDFAYGAITTRLRYQEKPSLPARFFDWLFFPGEVERPNFPNLAANLEQTMPPLSRGKLLLPASLVLETGGIRVGFIGLTSDIVTRMASPFAWGFEFLEGENAYRTLLDETAARLREQGAHTVVVISELGLHRDKQLADIVQPGIDFFFSAHTHELTLEPLASNSGARIVEAGNDGYLGRMDLVFRDGRLVGHDWHVLDVDASIPEDPEVAALVEEARAPFLRDDIDMDYPAPWVDMPLEHPIDRVVGETDRALHRRDVLHNPFNDMLAEVIRRAAGTQVSMTPGFRFDAIVLPEAAGSTGKVTLEQVYRYLPIAPSLATGEIRGADLRENLEVELTRVFSPNAFEHSGGWLGGFGGLEVDVDLSGPDGERVKSMRLGDTNEPLGDDDIVTVVSCVRPFDDDGVMCSNPNFESIRPLENPSTGRAWTPLEILVEAFATGDTKHAQPIAHVRDIGELGRWPDAPYMQPLHSHSVSAQPAAHENP
jgi:2',3'-cyclic-nucleotide 2'-phosphodiesterase (5'-nucleotidase family)